MTQVEQDPGSRGIGQVGVQAKSSCGKEGPPPLLSQAETQRVGAKVSQEEGVLDPPSS